MTHKISILDGMFNAVKDTKMGIPWCVNCVGLHPDHIPDIRDFGRKMLNAQKDVMVQISQLKKPEILGLYRDKSCQLCGRTYKLDGSLDTTWELTAKRVKQELDHAGVFAVDDQKVKLIVAKCRKSVQYLFENRMKINPAHWEKFTFSGTLVTIITHAQEGRRSKLSGGLSADNIKGLVR